MQNILILEDFFKFIIEVANMSVHGLSDLTFRSINIWISVTVFGLRPFSNTRVRFFPKTKLFLKLEVI